jgi:hypothetical protein
VTPFIPLGYGFAAVPGIRVKSEQCPVVLQSSILFDATPSPLVPALILMMAKN